MTSKRYSGYDEYEGIFGPLGVYGSDAAATGRRAGFQRSSRKSGRQRAPANALAHHAALFANARSSRNSSVETRERFLAARRAKRRLEPFDAPESDNSDCGDAVAPLADAGASHIGAAASATPLRQVWLPSRDFAFRQRAGKLDMRAIARVDIARVIATTDVDAIQRHVENLAFADVTLDDVQHYSDAYFLKLFQIAQLTLEYLLHVQESLVTHAEGVETQCEQLLTECQQLERDNSGLTADVAALKTEIRHKQRSLATFEVLLLNASAAQRRAASGASDKENAAAAANDAIDALLGASDKDDGAVAQSPVACVICSKKFVSPAFLVRHQQRKHARHTHQSSHDYYSDSASPTGARQPLQPARDDAHANALTMQLTQLQEQLQRENAMRDAQAAQLEQTQSQLATTVAGHMTKLEGLLGDLERKQEAAQRDVLQTTQTTLAKLQHDAAAAAAAIAPTRKQRAAARVGAIESDDDDGTSKRVQPVRSDNSANAPLERVLELFLRAQTQTQTQLDALALEQRQLASQHSHKTKSRRRRQRGDANDDGTDTPALSSLLQMAALDAKRFGVDPGVALDVPAPAPTVAVCEDKVVQTDGETDAVALRRAVATHEVQTDSPVREPVPSSTAVETEREPPAAVVPVRVPTPNAVAVSPPALVTPLQLPPQVVTDPSPLSQPSRDTLLQRAALVVGKVARGFLVRRALQHAANWLVCLPFAALAPALSDRERMQLQQRHDTGAVGRDLVVEVHVGMTANALRLAVAQALATALGDSDSDASVDYHRVLLHHAETREEIVGDRSVHALRRLLEVELVPRYDAAEVHVESVFAVHSDATTRLRALRDAAATGETNDVTNVDTLTLQRIVQLQTRVRSFLAKRAVAMRRLDRLVDQRLLHLREAANDGVASRRRHTSSEDADPQVASACEKVRARLAIAVQRRLGVADAPDCIAADALAQQLHALDNARLQLTSTVQMRIERLQLRLEPLVQSEYAAEQAVAAAPHERSTAMSAAHVVTARRRLQLLLGGERERCLPAAALADSETPAATDEVNNDARRLTVSSMSSLLRSRTSLGATLDETGESFDTMEIERLANAYEHGSDLQQSVASAVAAAATSTAIALDEPTQPMRSAVEHESRVRPSTPALEVAADAKPRSAIVRRAGTMPRVPIIAAQRAATPMTDASEPGRSPRPKLQDPVVISPFSKTPLLSRRSGAAAQRGSGYDNAR